MNILLLGQKRNYDELSRESTDLWSIQSLTRSDNADAFLITHRDKLIVDWKCVFNALRGRCTLFAFLHKNISGTIFYHAKGNLTSVVRETEYLRKQGWLSC